MRDVKDLGLIINSQIASLKRKLDNAEDDYYYDDFGEPSLIEYVSQCYKVAELKGSIKALEEFKKMYLENN